MGSFWDRRSYAQKALDPFALLELATDYDLDAAWPIFSERLKQAGFEGCAFGYGRRSIETPIGHPDTKLFGTVVSEPYLKAVRESPRLQSHSRPYRLIRHSARPVTFFGEDDLKANTPTELEISRYAIREFSLKGWALAPVHAPESDRLFMLGWWELEDSDAARKLWEAEGHSFALAAAYFSEAVDKVLSPFEAAEPTGLSPREMECLLWAGAGKTTAQIADILGVADGTVEEYFSRAAKKLGATTRAQACVKAVLNGLIRP